MISQYYYLTAALTQSQPFCIHLPTKQSYSTWPKWPSKAVLNFRTNSTTTSRTLTTKRMHSTDTNTFPKPYNKSQSFSTSKTKSYFNCKSQESRVTSSKTTMSTLPNSIKKLRPIEPILSFLICSSRRLKPET